MAKTKRAPASSASSVRDDDKPFILTATVKNVRQVTAANEAALSQGISPGMTLTHARALIPDIGTADADADADRLGLEKLADWCGRYSPLSGVGHRGDLWGDSRFSGDDGLWIDVTGCAHLFGGEVALLDDLGRRLDRFGIRHRLALAETMGAAWAIARFGEASSIIPPGRLSQALAERPVAGLRLRPETVTLLRRLGLKRIGQLEQLPRAALGKRFSSKDQYEAVLLRLDQAFGRRDEPLTPRRPPPLYRAEQGFLEPILELPGLAQGLSLLTADLCRMLARRDDGAERLALLAYRVDGDVKVLRVGASRATQDRRHLEGLFAEKLETIDPGFGIEKLALHAERTAPLDVRQGAFAGGSTETSGRDARLAQLIDRLANRLGADAVTVSVPVQSHLPERAEHHVSAMEAPSHSPDYVKAAEPFHHRPSSLLLRPEPITAMAEVPDGPPMLFVWRRVRRRIVKAEGPERLAPEWWVDTIDGVNLASETRDYFRVEDDRGQRYWLFREGLYERDDHADDGDQHQVNAVDRVHWFIHGLFG